MLKKKSEVIFFSLLKGQNSLSVWCGLASVYLSVLNMYVIEKVNIYLNTVLIFNLNTCGKLKEWIMIADGLFKWKE